jgi:hypothetical protein
MKLYEDPKIPKPKEILEDHTTPTNFSTLPSRWVEDRKTLLEKAPPPPPKRPTKRKP